MVSDITTGQIVDVLVGLLSLSIFAQALGFALAAAITQFTAPKVALALGAASGLTLSLATFVWRFKSWIVSIAEIETI